MSSFKDILNDILSNTKVTIDKNGIGIKNGDFNLNIPGNFEMSQSNVSDNNNVTHISYNDNEYEVKSVGISGIHDLFGGIHLTALISKDSAIGADIGCLWRRVPELQSTASTDSVGNRIRVMKGDDIVILSIEIPCQVYNDDSRAYQGPDDSIAIDIIRQHWTNSISNAIRLPMLDTPNVDEHIKRIGDFLLTIKSDDDCQSGKEVIWLHALTSLRTYFAEMGRSHIGKDIADCENLSYVPEVPGGRAVDFMTKYIEFFRDESNLKRCVKLPLLSKLLPYDKGGF